MPQVDGRTELVCPKLTEVGGRTELVCPKLTLRGSETKIRVTEVCPKTKLCVTEEDTPTVPQDEAMCAPRAKCTREFMSRITGES